MVVSYGNEPYVCFMEPRKHLHETLNVPRGAQRFRELIVYISRKCESDPHFGAVKLNKILYYSDFRAFERFGLPLTGMRYFRLEQGPAPRALLPVRNALIQEGALKIEYVRIGNVEQHRTIALRDPVLSHFTEDEIALVDSVIKELWNQNATEVSDASHDVRWRVLENQDPVPYEFAYLSDEPITEREAKRTKELAAELGW